MALLADFKNSAALTGKLGFDQRTLGVERVLPFVEQNTLVHVHPQPVVAAADANGLERLNGLEVNDNPRDTKDYEQGVWSLPPDYRQGSRDRARFEAIGESDRFTLKFVKRGP